MKTFKIYLKIGGVINKQVHLYSGPSFVGDPTAYVIRFGQLVWVKPSNIGDQSFVEV